MTGEIKLSQLIGKTVVDKAGKIVGNVHDIMIKLNTNEIYFLVKTQVKRGGNVKEIEYQIPISYISSIGDVILLDRIVEIKTLPG